MAGTFSKLMSKLRVEERERNHKTYEMHLITLDQQVFAVEIFQTNVFPIIFCKHFQQEYFCIALVLLLYDHELE